MENDIPRSVLIVLIIVSVVVSLLGTLTVLQESSRVRALPVQDTVSENGKVAITLTEAPAELTAKATGKVAVGILKSGDYNG